MQILTFEFNINNIEVGRLPLNVCVHNIFSDLLG
jgi:hypothetical protein